MFVLQWQTLAEDDSVVSRGFDALNVTQPFGVLHGAEDSRMLSGTTRRGCAETVCSTDDNTPCSLKIMSTTRCNLGTPKYMSLQPTQYF